MHNWLDPTLYPQLGISDHPIRASHNGVSRVEYCPNDDDVTATSDNRPSNRQLYYTQRGGGCDPDPDNPDGDCQYYAAAQPTYPFHSLQERVIALWDHTLYCAQDLYLAPCDAVHWLACNPTQQGIVAVLDQEALSLLELFRSVSRCRDAVQQWTSASRHQCDQPAVIQCARMVALFAALGLLIDKDKCDTANQSQIAGESRTLSVWLHITNACNMACTYCYVAKSSEHMTADAGKRAIDAVVRSALRASYQQLHLKYARGETALRLPQMLQLHDYAQQQAHQHHLRLSATLLSNGAALIPRTIQQLKQRHIGVIISLDVIDANHDIQRPLVNGMGSFRLVDRAITRLLEQGLVPHINVVVSNYNLSGLPDLIAYLFARDLPFAFSYYRENGCSASFTDLQCSESRMIEGMMTALPYIEQHLPPRRIYQSLIDKASFAAPHHYTCGARRNYLIIDQQGGIARCQTEITQTITTVDAEDPLQDIRRQQEGAQVLDVDEKEGCRDCNWRYWCGGGCAVLHYRLTGRNNIYSPNCGIYKALFPAVLCLESLRLLTYSDAINL
jgi:uncharacterized protein